MNYTKYLVLVDSTKDRNLLTKHLPVIIVDNHWDYTVIPGTGFYFESKYISVSELKESLASLPLEMPETLLIIKRYEDVNIGSYSLHKLHRDDVRWASDSTHMEQFLEEDSRL